jgi:capsule polysaccharide export protein KpsE/RkpR
MATLTLAYNHSRDPMNPDQLATQIASSLALTTNPTVDINATQIVVTHASITSSNTTAIQNLINAYVFDPNWAGGVAGFLTSKLTNALTTNATYLALATPTTAQNTAQIQQLTKEVNALIRQAIQALNSTSGT